MSLFDLQTSTAKASDFTKQLRIQEYKPESNNTTGNIKIRFSASQDRWWVPSASTVIMTFRFAKTGGNLMAADKVTFCENMAAAAASGGPCSHFINGVSVGTANEVARTSQLYFKSFLSHEAKNSVADIYNLTLNRREVNDNSNAIVAAFAVPLGLWQSFPNAIPSGDHLLQFTMSPNLIQSMIETNSVANNTGKSLPGLTLTCSDITLYAAFVSPQETIRPPPVCVLPLVEISTQTASHSVNGSSTFNLSVPSSTKKILIASSRADESHADFDGSTSFSGAAITQGPIVNYSGQTSPITMYNAADANCEHRKYIDFYLNQLMSGKSGFDELEAWGGDKVTAHYFAKSPSSTDTNAIVKVTANGATLPSSIVVAAIHDSAIVLSYDSSGQITSVNYNVVS